MADDVPLPIHGAAIDPVAMARRDMSKSLPRRFYREVTVDERDGAFALLLDGVPARTPARNLLALPTRAAAALVAEEWNGVGERIDPRAMPFTRIVNSALDGVARDIEGVSADAAKYAQSDLVCYRADAPQTLVDRQARAFDPILAFARDTLRARFLLVEGVMFAAQPEASLDAIARAVGAVAARGPLALAALHVMTTLTGSVLIALMIAQGRLYADAAWVAAHVDEDFQLEQWGTDEEALARRAARWHEMAAAARLLSAL